MRSFIYAGALSLTMCAVHVRAQDWTSVPSPTNKNINHIVNRYAVGDSGFYGSLAADGVTWSVYPTNTSENLNGFIAGSSVTYWICGGHGFMTVRSNGTYFDRHIPDQTQSYALGSSATGTAYVFGDGGSTYYTGNYGVNWTLGLSGLPPLHRGQTTAGGLAIGVGDNGTIVRIPTYGGAWSVIASGTTAHLYGVTIGATNTFYAVGAGGTILRSTDAGLTWTQMPSGVTTTLRSVSASNQSTQNVLACGDGGVVIKSTDSGVTWCRLDAGTTADLLAADMFNNTEYIVAGAGGIVRRTTTGGGSCQVTGVGDESRDGVGYALRVTGAAQVSLSVPRTQHVRVHALDVSGRRVAIVFDGVVDASAERTLDVHTRGWKNGVYVLRAEGDGFIAAQRMLVIAR